MHSTWLTVLFSVFENFFKLKRGNLISWGEPIPQKGWIICSPLLNFNFKHMKDQNILHHSLDINGSYMSQQFLKFPQIKKGDLISRGNQFRRRAALFVPVSTSPPAPHPQSPPLLLYFSFKHLKDPKSLSFIRFQYILHDSAVLLSIFENFVKLK